MGCMTSKLACGLITKATACETEDAVRLHKPTPTKPSPSRHTTTNISRIPKSALKAARPQQDLGPVTPHLPSSSHTISTPTPPSIEDVKTAESPAKNSKRCSFDDELSVLHIPKRDQWPRSTKSNFRTKEREEAEMVLEGEMRMVISMIRCGDAQGARRIASEMGLDMVPVDLGRVCIGAYGQIFGEQDGEMVLSRREWDRRRV